QSGDGTPKTTAISGSGGHLSSSSGDSRKEAGTRASRGRQDVQQPCWSLLWRRPIRGGGISLPPRFGYPGKDGGEWTSRCGNYTVQLFRLASQGSQESRSSKADKSRPANCFSKRPRKTHAVHDRLSGHPSSSEMIVSRSGLGLA